LDEIRELLEIGSDPFSPQLRALAERRLPDVERLFPVVGWPEELFS
jgi:hypothetical protein